MRTYGPRVCQQSTQENEEPYHCTPVYKPSDIICPGSDTEETPEETRVKRRRYEDAAKRYMAGQKPRILSASLRGPLTKESGWVNPWRHRPRRSKNGDWWQPRSEGMLFTRENVIERAVAYGLGYMTAKEALAWCKASAEAEAEEDGFPPTDDHHGSVKEPRSEEEEVLAYNLGKDSIDEVLRDHHDEKLPSRLNLQKHSSMLDNYRATTFMDDGETRRTRIAKRPSDTNWLKGSYVSKRARWEAPAHPSPTPQRAPRGHIKRPNRSDSARTHLEKSTIFLHETMEANDETCLNIHPPRPSSIFPQPLAAKPRSLPQDHGQLFILGSEEAKLIKAPHMLQPSKSLVSLVNTSSSGSNRPPVPLRDMPPSRSPETISTEEDSFITDVAPSSREVDRFVFRKKRTAHKPKNVERLFRQLEENHDKYPNTPHNLSTIITTPEGLCNANLSPPANLTVSAGVHVQANFGVKEVDVTEINTLNLQPDDLASNIIDNSCISIATEDKTSKHPLEQNLSTEIPRKRAGTWPKTGGFFTPPSQKSWHNNSQLPKTLPPTIQANSKSEEEAVVKYQDLNIISSSATVTPTRSRRFPARTPGLTRESSKVTRLRQFSFEKNSDGFLFSPHGSPIKEPHTRAASDQIPVRSQNMGCDSSHVQIEREDSKDYTQHDLLGVFWEGLDGCNTSKGNGPFDLHDITDTGQDHDEDTMDLIERWFSQNCSSMSPRLEPQGCVALHNKCVDLERAQLISSPMEGESEDAVDDSDQDINVTEVPCLLNGPIDTEDEKVARPPHSSHVNIETTDSNTALNTPICTGSDPEQRHYQTTQLSQSPFAQELFDVARPVLELETDDRDNNFPTVSDADSEASWPGCGPQSPWDPKASSLVPARKGVNIGSGIHTINTLNSDPLFEHDLKLQGVETKKDSSYIEPPMTAEEEDPEGIRPFSDFISPSRSPKFQEQLSQERQTSTQQIIDAALKNPWVSSLKTRTSQRVEKWVSFNHLVSDDCEASNIEFPEDFKEPPGSAPSLEEEPFEEDIFGTKSTPVASFNSHFNAARRSTHVLSENTHCTQISPSPAAQAEAFIAADLDSLRNGAQSLRSTNVASMTSLPKTSSNNNENSHWQSREQECFVLKSPPPKSPSPTRQTYGSRMASFNIEEALDQMGDFLEDWSVEGELKKVKGMPSTKEVQEDGQKTRRLFRLL